MNCISVEIICICIVKKKKKTLYKSGNHVLTLNVLFNIIQLLFMPYQN